jgi:hypothetical protein
VMRTTTGTLNNGGLVQFSQGGCILQPPFLILEIGSGEVKDNRRATR